jgi:hypothetical protein
LAEEFQDESGAHPKAHAVCGKRAAHLFSHGCPAVKAETVTILAGSQPEGWCFGSEEFRQELLVQVSAQAGPRHIGQEIGESAQAKAERILREELERLGWDMQDLERQRKGDARKVTIAARLRRETTMTLAWIAERLRIGAPAHVACLLYRQHNEQAASENKLF